MHQIKRRKDAADDDEHLFVSMKAESFGVVVQCKKQKHINLSLSFLCPSIHFTSDTKFLMHCTTLGMMTIEQD